MRAACGTGRTPRGRALRGCAGPADRRQRPCASQRHGHGRPFLDGPSVQRLSLARRRQDDRALHQHRDRHDDRRGDDRVPRPRRRRPHPPVGRDRRTGRGRARDTGRAAHLILAFKLVLTPALIAAATLVGRRFGPSISGWLVGLPFTSGPVSLFLTLEQGTSFAAAAAAGSIGGVAASAIFAVAYAAMARRFGWPASLAVASLAFAVTVIALRALPLGSGLPLPLLALYAGGVAAAIIGIRLIPPPGALDEAPAPPPWDLPVR